MKYALSIFLIFLAFSELVAQESKPVHQTFGDRRIINTHSVEMLPARKLDFRIGHRFGDLAGSGGGWSTFYGLENASDVMIGFEYGVRENLMVGLNRTKGAGPLRQLINTFGKFRLMTQGASSTQPISLVVLGLTTVSTQPKSETEGVLHFFESPAHRWSYHLGLLAARKFSERFSVQASASWTYRNIVPAGDKNDLPALGLAGRAQITKSLGLILDTTFPISSLRNSDNDFYPALGLGVEFNTSGGHVFQMNFTNTRGISETDYIPYSQSNIGDGEFRLGFTISRLFSL
jgi:hypothetical protein